MKTSIVLTLLSFAALLLTAVDASPSPRQLNAEEDVKEAAENFLKAMEKISRNSNARQLRAEEDATNGETEKVLTVTQRLAGKSIRNLEDDKAVVGHLRKILEGMNGKHE
ncbi:hypothetical protein BBJ28_00002251 [Nothophytophthora sp. Chile5]|nr:hypothetical protein BBJ28_00002251 [Nothophytophthora sp. Chile5]